MHVADVFHPRSNALNSMRLFFALVVIFVHTYSIGGFGRAPGFIGDNDIGAMAVASFFVASGYLISKSRRRSGFWRYMWARCLRIYPAFWMSLLATAFIAAYIGGQVRGGWTFHDAIMYCIKDFTLKVKQWTIGGTLSGAHYDLAWNGSMWTLYHEFGLYVIVGILLSIPALRRNRWTLTAGFVLTTILALANHYSLVGSQTFELALWAVLAPFFFAGCVIADFDHVIPANWWIFFASVAVVIGSSWLGWGRVISPLPLAFCVMWLAAKLPLMIERWGDGQNDLSYGMYIYVMPIQQLLVFTVFSHNVAIMVIAAVAITLVPVIMSWFWLERPMMRLKSMPEPAWLVRLKVGARSRFGWLSPGAPPVVD